jgi:hypothetical protein
MDRARDPRQIRSDAYQNLAAQLLTATAPSANPPQYAREPTMKIWIDCEWNDFKGELISMALVAEDGSEWYEVLECANPSPWIAKHVMSVTQKDPISKARMQSSLSKYLAKYPTAHIISDWPEDIERFCALLITGPGKMLGLRQARLTLEINFNLNSNDSKIPHQALADARSMKLKYSTLAVL